MLIDWVGCDLLMPEPAPYRYELLGEGTVEDFPELGLPISEALTVQHFAVRDVANDSDLATLHVAQLGEGIGPVLLDWQTTAGAQALALPGHGMALDRLADSVIEHVPEGAVMLSWWDTSRQLSVLTGVAVHYDQNLPRPLILPPDWHDKRDSIEALERVFWRMPEPGTGDFGRYLDALTAPATEGIATLARIADGRPAFIAVQLADAYKLALARPQAIGIGYRDFSRTGDIHDDIRQVKDWLARQGFGVYAVEQMGIARNRVYYAADEETADSLLMRMLPFGEFEPLAVAGLKLVANYGSYWVYEIVQPIPE